MSVMTSGSVVLFGACLSVAWSLEGCAGKALVDGEAAGGRSTAASAAGRSNQAAGSASGGSANSASGGNDAGHLAGAPTVSTGSGGSGFPGIGGSGVSGIAGAPLAAGVPLTPVDGWIDGTSNMLKIQGAIFSFADTTSSVNMSSDFSGSHACIQGTAARVDLTCTPIAPATDCYGMYFGSAIGLNLNQAPPDLTTDPVTYSEPLSYDASAMKGFSFEISGDIVPEPRSLRFEVEDGTQQFCTPASVKIKPGVNTVLFSDLLAWCWITTDPPNPSAETAQSKLIKLTWHVVTNNATTVPFSFCVSNIRALLK